MDFMQYMNKKYNMDKKKRNRSDNWVPADKNLLEELVIDGRIDIVECKNTDTNTNTMKMEAWLEIQESFNKKCQGPQRTVLQLKSQWACIKKIKKKESKTSSAPLTAFLKCSSSTPPIKSSPPNSPGRSSVSSAPSSPSTPSTLPSPVPSPLPQIHIIPSPRPSTETRAPKQKPKEHYLETIAAVEMRCRTELHKLQCQNELLKNKMLLKKLEVQEQKLKYYKLECAAVKNKK